MRGYLGLGSFLGRLYLISRGLLSAQRLLGLRAHQVGHDLRHMNASEYVVVMTADGAQRVCAVNQSLRPIGLDEHADLAEVTAGSVRRGSKLADLLTSCLQAGLGGVRTTLRLTGGLLSPLEAVDRSVVRLDCLLNFRGKPIHLGVRQRKLRLRRTDLLCGVGDLLLGAIDFLL